MPPSLDYSLEEVLMHRILCQEHLGTMMAQLRGTLGPKGSIPTLLEIAGLWPRYSIKALLILLSRDSVLNSQSKWKHFVLRLGLAITVLQRARRMLMAIESEDVSNFYPELRNSGHLGWDVDDFPEWLLIEVENDFMIRPIQAQVAQEMIAPSSGANSLIQLNMGKYRRHPFILHTKVLTPL